jgi:protein-glutamine gamma-glutamyltransferase
VFGLLLALFLFDALWTLSVFTCSRARQKYSESNRLMLARNGLLAGGRDATAVFRQSGELSVQDCVWNQRSQSISTIQLDPRMRWISWPFVGGVVANLFLCAMIGGLFFLLTPRIWVGSFATFDEGPDRALRALQSGFAEEVQLGDIGQILEGTRTVFEVRMFDQRTNHSIDLVSHAAKFGLDEPLFRGSVMGEYASGKWRVGRTGEGDEFRGYPWAPNSDHVVRQEFRLEPTESGILFAMSPHSACWLEHKHSRVFARPVTSVLYRDERVSGRETIKYLVLSDKPDSAVIPEFTRATRSSRLLPSSQGYYCQLPGRGLEQLQAFARQLAQSDNDPNPSPQTIARRLQHFLRDDGGFSYTLDMSIDDPTIDAVEDFLFNRRRGHCEYFASALALMLRAVGIPARLASGFKGGDLNTNTGYFVVQERHAHVWVEAYLNRQWVILDPTPASRADSVKSLAPKVSVWNNLLRSLSDLWTHQIVGLSLAEQNSSLYVPLKEWGATFANDLADNTRRLLQGDFQNLHGARWLGALLLIALLTLIVSVGWWVLASASARHEKSRWLLNAVDKLLTWILPNDPGTRQGSDWRSRLSRWCTSLLGRLRGEIDEPRLRVEFYERFLRVLRLSGLEPLPAQTAHEFVVDTQPQWRGRLNSTELAEVPPAVVAQFYRVRFGGESLSADELRWLDQQLGCLEESWRHRDVPR